MVSPGGNIPAWRSFAGDTGAEPHMTAAGELNIGHIPYLNSVPFFHFLQESGFDGNLVSGVPSELNRMLQQGELAVSPSSSFEYARNWQDYFLLPGHSISSCGKVQSVLLFSPVALGALEGEEIAITGESATSINLLRVILREFQGLRKVVDAVPDRPVEELIAAGRPALLIGDRALQTAEGMPVGMQCFDLGELWYRQTGLPFVFALWMVRRDAVSSFPEALAKLADQLRYSREKVLATPDEIAAACAPSSGLTAAQIITYWNGIDYRLEKAHLTGLKLFFKLCAKYDLLNREPPLEFLPDRTD